ncbi:MAG: AAA family ATPase [Rubrobacter sp.]|nr:AAA family ATPase [Rubrobacter sp.]
MLTAIYIKGFKTFARPVRMPLEAGITAVVGPNGSGKSNITDAVLFALGEQSPGLLRAGAMGDVIFSGSETLPAARTAEVTLVLDNSSGGISLPYEEVSISRRISRDGETEYRINGSAARLQDVRAVAGEAGIGRHSILRQGAVDSIVSGGPDTSRLALEEAAGLGVYRRRRLSASRRLERADAQLEKSRQLETELAGQLRRIEQEAVAAREYREIESRFRRYSLAHLYRTSNTGLDALIRKTEQTEAHVAVLEEREASLRRQGAGLEPDLQEKGKKLREIEQALEGLEDGTEELRMQSIRADRAFLRLEGGMGREADRGRVISRLEAELERTSGVLESLENEEAQAKTERSDKQKSLAERRETLSWARSEREAAEREKSRAIVSLEKLRTRRDRATLRADEATEIPEQDIEDLTRISGELEDVLSPDFRGQIREIRKGISVARRAVDEGRSGAGRRKGALDAAVGRLEASIRVLRSSRENGGLETRLYQVLKAKPGFEAAVEAALGDFAGGVLAENVDEGIKLLSEAERIAVRLDAHGIDAHGNPPGTPLLDCIEVLDGRYSEAVGRLLQGIYVVDKTGCNTPSNGYVAVTRSGLRLTRTSVSLPDGGGSFVREARFSEASRRLDALMKGPGALLRGKRDELADASGRLENVSARAGASQNLADRVSGTSKMLLREIRRRQGAWEDARKLADSSRKEAANLEREISTNTESMQRSESRLRECQERLDSEVDATEITQADLRETERRHDRIKAAVREARNRQRAISERLESLNQAPLEEARTRVEVSRRAAGISARLAEVVRERRGSLRRSRSETADKHRRISAEQTAIARQAAELAGELAAARANAGQARTELGSAREAAELAEEEIGAEWGATIEDARRESEQLPADIEAERRRLARKLHRFGDVNLLALAQQQGLRERHEFVSAQRADAEAASSELSRIIQDIDGEIEARFSETFRGVKAAFTEIVPRMMHGASGTLELSEEGVEILLRLGRRGYKPLRVLSGGERSLLALSFLFSIFLSRPEGVAGTFCVLDEAEAALDDLNLARFLSVVDSHRIGGQFLLVTHQKRTMAAADVLYGVTQDAWGATVIVSKRMQGD